MSGGLHYENVGQMPPGMRERMVEQVLEKVLATAPVEKGPVMEIWFCYGKGGLCAVDRCQGEKCPCYDGRGGRKPREGDA